MMKNENNFTKIQELLYELKVSDAMRTEVYTIKPQATINDLRIELKNHRISGLPVCKEDKKLSGIISIEDLIRCLLAGRLNCKIEEEMSRNVSVLYSDEPLIHAVSKFEKLGFGRFPVLSRDSNELVGIITKGDIVRSLLKKLEINYREEEIQRYRASHIFEDINSDMSSLIMKYKIAGNDFKNAGAQSSRLKKNLKKLNLPPDIVRRVSIASYEAEMNIIIFTPGGELIVNVSDECVAVKAVDKGPGILDIDKAMQPGYSTAPEWVRELGFGAGMGLPNIKKCADEMRINSKLGERTELEFVVYTKR